MTDTRVWMYREGEAVCFASLKTVPQGEGWADHPVPQSGDQTAITLHSGSNERLPGLGERPSLDDLRGLAKALDIQFHRNAGVRKLTQLINVSQATGRTGDNHGTQS